MVVGDKIDVVVIKYDPENKRISLGMKQFSEDPWEDIDTIYPVGEKLNLISQILLIMEHL